MSLPPRKRLKWEAEQRRQLERQRAGDTDPRIRPSAQGHTRFSGSMGRKIPVPRKEG